MTNKNMLLLTSALVAFAAYGGLAHAQSTAAPAQSAAAPAASGAAPQSDNNPTQVSDVIVTVNKRDEKIEDVPVAVTAFTPEQRDLEGVTSIFDFTRAVPSFEYSTTLDRAFIRGVGRNTNAPGTQAGVAIYVDGFYTPSTYGIDRASILSGNFEADAGPQGTLFGRNAIGGLIQQTTAHATDEWTLQTDTRFEDHDRIDQAVSWGGPVNDKIKLLLGYDYRDQTGGYFHNLALNEPSGGPTNERFYLGVLDYTVNDRWDGFIKYEFSSFDRYLSGFSSYGSNATLVDPFFNDYTNQTNFLNINEFVNCAPAPDPVTGVVAGQGTFGTSNFHAFTPANCPAFAAKATTFYDPTNPAHTNIYNFKSDYRTLAASHNDWDVVLNNTWHLPMFDVKYIGGYQQYIYNNLGDGDGTARGPFTYEPFGDAGLGFAPAVTIDPIISQYYENRKWSSHEVDFSSNAKDSPLTWIVGLYYYRDNFDNHVDDYSPLQNELKDTPGLNDPGNNFYNFNYDAKTESEAIFGQADYKFTPKWTLTIGGRYSRDEEHTFEQDHYYSFTPGFISQYNTTLGMYPGVDETTAFGAAAVCSAAIASAGATCTTNTTGPNNIRQISDSWGGWGAVADLSYKPTDDSLAYIKYSRGYKAGGIVLSAMTASPILRPESLDSYEAGYKFSPGRSITLNADVYYYNYANYQDFGSVSNPAAPSGQSTVGFNIPRSRNYGAELLGDWHPVHWFTLSGTFDYLNAKVTNGGTVALEDLLDPLATGHVTLTNNAGTTTSYSYKPQPCKTIPATLTSPEVVLQCITGDALKGASPYKVWLNFDFKKDFDEGTLDIIPGYSWRAGNVSTYSKDPIYKAASYSETDIRIVWTGAGKWKKYQVIGFVDNIFNLQGTEYVTATKDATNQVYLNKQLTVPQTWGLELKAKF